MHYSSLRPLLCLAVLALLAALVGADDTRPKTTWKKIGEDAKACYELDAHVVAKIERFFNHRCRGRTVMCPHCGDSGRMVVFTVTDWRCTDLPDVIRNGVGELEFKIGPNPDLGPPRRGPVRGAEEEAALARKHAKLAAAKPGQAMLVSFKGTARKIGNTDKCHLKLGPNGFDAFALGEAPGGGGDESAGKDVPCTQAVQLTFQTPSSAERLQITDVRQVGEEIWVLSQIESGGIGAAVISRVNQTVYIAPTTKPIRHYVFGKRWNWGKSTRTLIFVREKEEQSIRAKADAGTEVRFTRRREPETNRAVEGAKIKMMRWETKGGGDIKFSIVPVGEVYKIKVERHDFRDANKTIGLGKTDGEAFEMVNGIFNGTVNVKDHTSRPVGATGSWTTIYLTDAEGKTEQVRNIKAWDKLGVISRFVDGKLGK